MKLKIKYFSIMVIVALLLVSACSSDEPKISKNIIPIYKNSTPLLTIGSDNEDATTALYKAIYYFHLDEAENIYIPDIVNGKFDKYDKHGHFVTSFGRKGEGPGEHKAFPENIAVNSKGFVFNWSFLKQRLIIYKPDGSLLKEIKIVEKPKTMYIRKLKFDHSDNLFMTCYSESEEYSIVKFDYDNGTFKIIHKDNKRIKPNFRDFCPGFDFDEAGNIYIPDLIDYKVFKYSTDGILVDTFQKEAKKIKIEEKDFIVLRKNRISYFPGHLQILNRLKGDSGYFPCISSIDIDGNRMYLWTPYQDEKKQYIVDVYDINFKNLCSTAYYNRIGDNLTVIHNNKFYTLNLGSDDEKLKNQIGRFGVFNWPHMVQCFEISPEILEK